MVVYVDEGVYLFLLDSWINFLGMYHFEDEQMIHFEFD